MIGPRSGANGLPKVSAHDRADRLAVSLERATARAAAEMLGQVALEDVGEQAVGRTPHRRDLLQNRGALGVASDGALERVDLTPDASQPGQ